MADNSSQNSYYRVAGTAAGTTVVIPRPGSLERVILHANKTGTVSLYDTALSTGTAATTFITDIENTSGSIPTSIDFSMRVKKGLTVVSGGTVDVLFIYQ